VVGRILHENGREDIGEDCGRVNGDDDHMSDSRGGGGKGRRNGTSEQQSCVYEFWTCRPQHHDSHPRVGRRCEGGYYLAEREDEGVLDGRK
jgi:hypothetical protein